MRTFGVFLLFVFCVVIGFYMYEYQNKKLKNTLALAQAMNKINMLFKYSRFDKQKIIELVDFDRFTHLNEIGAVEAGIYGIALEYFNSMGIRDYESEKNALELALLQINKRVDDIEVKYKHSKKLSLSLGFISGLFIVIVLI